jgi:hypothetical protein
MAKGNTENMVKIKNTHLKSYKRDNKSVIKNTEKRQNGKRTTRRKTPRKSLKGLEATANISPNQDHKIVQPTTESTLNLQTSLYLQLPNPNTSRSLPS